MEVYRPTGDYDGNWRETDIPRLLGFDPHTLLVTAAAPIPESLAPLYREARTWRRREVTLWRASVIGFPLTLYVGFKLIERGVPRALHHAPNVVWGSVLFGFVFSFNKRRRAEHRFDIALEQAYRDESRVIIDALTALDQLSAQEIVHRLNHQWEKDLFPGSDSPSFRRLMALNFASAALGDHRSQFLPPAYPIQPGIRLRSATGD